LTSSFTVHSGSHLTPRNTEATPNQFKIRTMFSAKVLLSRVHARKIAS